MITGTVKNVASIPLQRSKQYLEEKGFHVWILEHWNSWVHIRQDAWGLADLGAFRHDVKGTWYVNACEDNGAVSEHIKAYLNGGIRKNGKHMGESFPPNPHLPVMLAAGNRFSIMGWGKRCRDGRGTRKEWTMRLIEFYLDGAEVKWKEIAIN